MKSPACEKIHVYVDIPASTPIEPMMGYIMLVPHRLNPLSREKDIPLSRVLLIPLAIAKRPPFPDFLGKSSPD